MIRTLFFIVLSTHFSIFGVAQNIDKYIKGDTLTFSVSAISNNESIYLIKGKGRQLSFIAVDDPILYKLDKALNIKDSLSLKTLVNPAPQSVSAFFVNMAFKGDDTLVVTFNVNFNSSSGAGVVAMLDTSFSQLSQFSLNLPGDSVRYGIQKQKIEGNTILLSGSTSKASIPLMSSPYLARYDFSGNKIAECIIPIDTFLSLSFPPLSPNLSIGDFAYVPEGFLVSFYPYSLPTNLALIDSTFTLSQLIEVKDQPNGYLIDSHIQFLESDNELPKLISETSFFLDSIFLPPDTVGYSYDYKNISIISLDSNYAFSSIDTFAFSKNKVIDTVFQYLLRFDYNLFAINQNQDTALVMSTDMEPSAFYFSKPANTTYLSCFNPKTGTLYWSRIFNNGYSHDAKNLVYLENNKWLLSFNEYNWDKYGDETMCIHLIVIDANGNPIGITENEEIALTQEPIVYPNPASTQLTVGALHWPGNVYNYQLSDLKGACVQEGVLPETGQINLNQNLEGVYILTITNQTGFGWARKIIVH